MNSVFLTLLGVDPGTTTGFIELKVECRPHMKGLDYVRDATMKYVSNVRTANSEEEYDFGSFVCERIRAAQEMENVVLLVIEDFILRLGGSAEREGLSPVRVTSSISTMLFHHGMTEDMDVNIRLQMPARGKRSANKRVVDGQPWAREVPRPHALDAACHVVEVCRTMKVGRNGLIAGI